MRRLLVAFGAILISFGATAACGSFSSSGPTGEASTTDAGSDRAVTPPDDSGGGSDAGAERDAIALSSASGCADGTREGFGASEAGIAACEGAWTVPGVLVDASAQCARAAGNTGTRSNGTGCSVADLCAVGWHVCRDAADVLAHGGAAANDVCTTGSKDGGATFYATAQPSDGVSSCIADAAAVNDVFGCGDIASAVGDCAPLDMTIGTFAQVPGFAFGSDSNTERVTVIKGPGPGGVLCCLD